MVAGRRISIHSGKTFLHLLIFFHVEENEPKEDARVPRILRAAQPAGETAPHAGSGVDQLARVLTIGRLLRASLSLAALPGSLKLASSTG